MKAVFVGASTTSVMTARALLERGHEVVIIEKSKDAVESLSEALSCGFILGDGSKPAILKESEPGKASVLYCLTNHDQTNILASLVGRSLGFSRVVTKIQDPEFEHICIELGLENTIIPSLTIGRRLADMFEGRDPFELSTIFRLDTKILPFIAQEKHCVALHELSLPKMCRVMCIYRKNQLIVPESDTEIKLDDEMIILTDRDHVDELREQFAPAAAE